MGIEPTLSAWKAEVLPLNYTRNENLFIKIVVGTTRFEHATPWSQTRCSTKLSYVPKFYHADTLIWGSKSHYSTKETRKEALFLWKNNR